MGQMHFDVPEAARGFFDQCHWNDAYLCGIEGVPWQTRNHYAHGRLTLNRSVDTSAKLLVNCPVPKIGYRVLTTCSLRCSDKPHRLLVELARGCCDRVRIQMDLWQRGGLTLSDQFDSWLMTGTSQFLDAVQLTCDDPEDPEGVRAAVDAIASLEQAASELGNLFSAQSIAFRRSRENRLNTMLAVGVLPPLPAADDVATDSISVSAALGSSGVATANHSPAEAISQAFNAAAVRISWGDIETDSGRCDFNAVTRSLDACVDQGLRVIGGPLVDYRQGMLPQWLTLLEDDFDKLVATMNQFVESAVMQFRGRVNLWNAASGLNTAGPLGLDDEQVMRLSIGILQTIRRCDPNTPVIMSLDQPCGEYLAKDQNGISPLHFADALLRSGLGLAGIGLNFRFGFDQGSTHPRSPIEFAQMLDRWATLNTPLLVQLSVAGSPAEDVRSRLPIKPQALDPTLNGEPGAWAQFQHDFTKPLVDTLLSKQIVHAIVWDGWSDTEPHMVPNSGLIDASGVARPMLGYLTNIRKELLL